MGKPKRKVTPTSKAQSRSLWARLRVPALIGLVVVMGLATWFFLPRKSAVSDAAQYRGGPRLAVDRDLIDFGSVRFERRVQARFRLRNVGDKTLRLPAFPPVEVVEGC
jgi:hypothetical protein